MKAKELTGKVALITGASKGLGKAMALVLAEAAAKLALVSRDERLLAETAAALALQDAEAGVFPADISDEAQVLAFLPQQGSPSSSSRAASRWSVPTSGSSRSTAKRTGS